MKNFIFTIALTVCFYKTHCQKKEISFFTSLSTSYQIASPDFKTNIYSFSKSGIKSSLMLDYFFKNLGISSSIWVSNFKPDEDILIKYAGNISGPTARSSKAGNLKQVVFLIGPSYKYINKKMVLITSLKYGVAKNNQDEVSVIVNNNERIWGNTQANKNSDIWSVDFNAMYMLNKKVFLGLLIDFINTKNKVNTFRYNYSNGTISYALNSYKIVSTGVGLKFGIKIF
jgi:hypothetical protein